MLTNPQDDHLVITPSDRYHGAGPKVLWIDWHWQQVETCLNLLRNSPIKIIFHAFSPHDSDHAWLLDVAHQADIIIMDAEAKTAADIIKGQLISWDKCYYYGRKDLAKLFPGHIEDPTGKMLVWIAEITNMRIDDAR